MSRSYISSPPSFSMACIGTAKYLRILFLPQGESNHLHNKNQLVIALSKILRVYSGNHLKLATRPTSYTRSADGLSVTSGGI
jgi:hypothetical protein